MGYSRLESHVRTNQIGIHVLLDSHVLDQVPTANLDNKANIHPSDIDVLLVLSNQDNYHTYAATIST
mgnify:CR=1 FL=1